MVAKVNVHMYLPQFLFIAFDVLTFRDEIIWKIVLQVTYTHVEV